MNSSLSDSLQNPESKREMDESTGPIEPVMEPWASPVDDPHYRRVRRNPWVMGVVIFITLFLVFLGIGVIGHRVLTDSWGLPWVKEYPPLPMMSTTEGPSSTAAPLSTPETPPPQTVPTGPVAQGVPTHIVVRRGDTIIINTDITGVYDCPQAGATINPPGNLPYWLSCSSQVGDGMTIPAVIVGHTENGNSGVPFGRLGLVQVGDRIDITVPAGIVAFQADNTQKPGKGQMGFGPENDTTKLVSCDLTGALNVVVTGHRVS